MIDMPRDSEIAMGRAHYFRLLKGANVLPPNHPASLLVSQVGKVRGFIRLERICAVLTVRRNVNET